MELLALVCAVAIQFWGVDTNNKLMTKFCDLGGQKSHLDDSILDIDVVVVVVFKFYPNRVSTF